jgi:hypothetical protein
VDASSFGCVVILSLYLTLSSVISSLIVGIIKSLLTFCYVCTTEHLQLFEGLYFDYYYYYYYYSARCTVCSHLPAPIY